MRFILAVIALLIVSSCSVGHSYRCELETAQTEMKTAPEKALERLNAIDVSEISDSASLAQWALLYSEALNINHIKAPSDTIVNIAIKYYTDHGDSVMIRRAKLARQTDSLVIEADRLIAAQYLQKVREYSLLRERQAKQTVIYLSLILLISAAATIVWLISRLRIKKAETDALLAEAASLRIIATDNTSLREAVSKLFDTRFELIDKLCNTYYQAQGTSTEKTLILSQVTNEIDSLRTDKAVFAGLEKTVNDACDNILLNLRNALPGIKPEDYALAVYLSCGFSNRSIALLLEEKIETIYKRKSRLKQRINDLPDEKSKLLNVIFADGQNKLG